MRAPRPPTTSGSEADVSALDIDRDAAHDAAQRELSKPIYPNESLTERVLDWIDHLLYRIMVELSGVPGGWFTVAVLAVLIVIAVIVAIRIARRTMHTNRGGAAVLFDSQELSAAQHRAIAEQHAAQGDWGPAIRHRLRAVARHLEQSGALNPVPGRTATELAHDAGASHPELSGELLRAAGTFNDVTYGEQPGTEAGYRLIADLDERLRTRRPVREPVESAATWAPVR